MDIGKYIIDVTSEKLDFLESDKINTKNRITIDIKTRKILASLEYITDASKEEVIHSLENESGEYYTDLMNRLSEVQ